MVSERAYFMLQLPLRQDRSRKLLFMLQAQGAFMSTHVLHETLRDPTELLSFVC